MRLKVILLIASSFFFSQCKKEQFEFPLVFTGKVSEISNEGATLNGRISNSDNIESISAGFIWALDNDLKFESAYKMFAEGVDENGNLKVRLNTNLISGEDYYVRAFLVIDDIVCLGTLVSFKSLGAMAPVIKSIDPETGFWWDTITITGNRFGQKISDNEVLFGETLSKIIDLSDSTIVTLVPLDLSYSPVSITVSVNGNDFSLPYCFQITPPCITSVNPPEGNFRQTVTIKGRNFIDREYYSVDNELLATKKTEFMFANDILDVTIHSDTMASIIMPHKLPDGSFPFVAINGGSISNDTHIYYNHSLAITEISPMIGDFGDTVTLSGFFYSGAMPVVKVWVGKEGLPSSQEATWVEASETSIRFVIPTFLLEQKNNISVVVDGMTAYSSEQFELFEPTISSVSPEMGVFSDTITIKGEHFNPDMNPNPPFLINEPNYIYIGEQRAINVSASANEIKVLVPSNLSPGHYPLRYDMGFFNKIIGSFEILSLELINLSTDTIRLGSRIYIEANNTPSNLSLLNIRIGNSYFSVPDQEKVGNTFYADIPISSIPHGNFDLYLISDLTEDSKPVISINPFEWKRPNLTLVYPSVGLNSWVFSNSIHVLRTRSYNPEVLTFNTETQVWSGSTNYPSSYRKQSTSFEIDSYVYSGLGHYGLDWNNVYSDVTDTFYKRDISSAWEPIASLPGEPRRNAISFSVNGKGYTGSGLSSSSTELVDFWEYSPLTDDWLQKTDMPQGNAIKAFGLDGFGYVLFTDNRFYRYDPVNDLWEGKTPIPIMSLECCAFVISDKAYIGVNNLNSLQMFLYDPVTDTWKEKARHIFNFDLSFSNMVNNIGYIHGYRYFISYDPLKDL